MGQMTILFLDGDFEDLCHLDCQDVYPVAFCDPTLAVGLR